MKAAQLSIRDVVTANPGESVLDAAQRMSEANVAALVVVEGHAGALRPVGIVTDRDLVSRALSRGNVRLRELRIADVMRTDLITAHQDDDVDLVLATLDHHGIRQVPVVDADDRLQGLLTRDDIVSWMGSSAATPQPGEARHPAARAIGGGLAGGLIAGVVLGVVAVMVASLGGYDISAGMKLAAWPVLGDRALLPGFDAPAIVLGMLGYLLAVAAIGALIGLAGYRASRPAIVNATRREQRLILRPSPAKLV